MQEWRKWQIIKIKEADWPESLKRVTPRIKQLYCRGEWDKNLFAKALAVVGSRRMTKYGSLVTERLVSELVEANYTIVSGFMYGIDSTAHKACLENKGRTVAVLGCGLDYLVPAENDKLYTRILANKGLVLSEFEPRQEAKLWTFPYRNRIVVGLTQGLLVIEAGEKSGSLITARWAFKQKKTVMAIPGPVTAELSKGTNWLIKNGAVLVRNASEVLEELGEEKRLPKQQRLAFSKREETIINLLKSEALDADEIARRLNKNITTVSIWLSKLCLRGIVEEDNGKFMLGLGYVD